MSDHKHPGRSKGDDYKAAQHAKSEHRGLLPSRMKAGVTIKTQDGQLYQYDEHGAVRRIEK
jgi:hypothetical protein